MNMENDEVKVPSLSLSAASMTWSCTVRVYAGTGDDASVSYEEVCVGRGGGETTIGDIDSSEITTNLGRLLLGAGDCYKIVGLTGIWAEPALPGPDSDFLALCWCYEHEYEAVARFLAMLDADQRRQIFDLFDGFRDDELCNFCVDLLSLQTEECREFVESMGAVIDRKWFDVAATDVASRAAAELDRLRQIENWKAEGEERTCGRPEEVQNPAALVERFGTRVPLGYLAHATEYPRPERGIIEALLLSWGTQEGDMPSGLWRHLHTDGNLAVLDWVLGGREEAVLAAFGHRRDAETNSFFRKLNRLIAEHTRTSPPTGGIHGAILREIRAFYMKLKEAVPESYR
jgi:hypothetical protein